MLEAEKRLGEPLEVILPRIANMYDNLTEAGKILSIHKDTYYLWLRSLGFSHVSRWERGQ
jgi:hypothetical protein